MHNLTVWRNIGSRKLPGVPLELPLVDVVFDVLDCAVIFAYGLTKENPKLVLISVSLDEFDNVTDISKIETKCIGSLEIDFTCSSSLELLDLHLIQHDHSLCAVFKDGNVYVIRGEHDYDVIGSVEEGIDAVAWSWDEDILALATAANTLVFVTDEFEVLASIELSPEDVSTHINHVSVGWGRKETQYQGRGKALARDPTLPDEVDSGKLCSDDTFETYLSWRHDSQYIAINRIEGGTKRVIRVYSRDAQIISFSEPVDGLRSAIDWKPDGSLVTAISTDERRGHEIIFFEKNGLRHGQFSIEGNLKTNEVHWNCDGTVLAVQKEECIELWTVQNYHYYLKQKINAPKSYRLRWHPEHPMIMIICSSELFQLFEFNEESYTSSSSASDDLGAVAVVDGTSIQITPFAYSNIPPPLSALTFKVKDVPINASFSPNGDMLVLIFQSCFAIASWSSKGLRCPSPHAPDIKYHEIENATSLKQIAFIDDNKFSILLSSKLGSTKTSLLIYKIQDDNILLERENKFDFEAIKLGRCLNSDKIYICSAQSRLFFIETARNQSFWESHSVPRQILDIQVYQKGKNLLYFILDNRRTLSLNGELLHVGVTSFILKNDLLSFTTRQGVVKFAQVIENLSLTDICDDKTSDERIRAIERNSIIVTTVPTKNLLIMQHPRGNLETVSPRCMVLDGIRKELDDLNFQKVFLTCREHRVDLSYLYYYNPSHFLSNISLFVQQLPEAEYLDLFIIDFKDEDVASKMYPARVYQSAGDNTDKIESEDYTERFKHRNVLLNALLVEFSKDVSDRFLQSSLTAYLAKQPQEMENALRLVGRTKPQSETRIALLTHICFLANVDKLYDAALGIYDLHLALEIARRSQKDPKEYVTYLKFLEGMSEERRLFTIDNDLGRYSSALSHLIKDEEAKFDRFRLYAIKHSLLPQLLNEGKLSEDQKKMALNDYGAYLSGNGSHAEAGLVYEMCNDIDLSMDEYSLSGDWQQVLSIAQKFKSAEFVKEKAKDLIYLLTQRGDSYDAAIIHADYFNEYEEAIALFCKCYHFGDARRMATKDKSLEPSFRNSVMEVFSFVTETISEMKKQLNSQIPRLEELEEKRKTEPVGFFESPEAGDDIPDNISVAETEATTNASIYTRYTNNTSSTKITKNRRQRRREDRKKARGKKGTIYEESYIIGSISRLIERVNKMNPEISSLVETLLRLESFETAMECQKRFNEVISILRDRWDFVEKQRITNDQNELAALPLVEQFSNVLNLH